MKILKDVVILTLMITMAFFFSTGISNAVEENQPVKLEGKLNINTATAGELTLLPGIGEKTAEKIVEYRTSNGPFKEAGDLVNVKGVGEKKLETIKDYIDIEGENTLKPVEK